MRNNLLLSIHGHGKAANRCLGQKRSANLSLSAYMQVGGANEPNGQRCFSSRHLRGIEPFGCQPVEVMIAAIVAPLGRRSSPSTRACFEFARLVCRPLRAAFTLDEDRALVGRPRLRIDMQTLLSIAPAQHRAATT
jgi:hypothetical protein